MDIQSSYLALTATGLSTRANYFQRSPPAAIGITHRVHPCSKPLRSTRSANVV